MNRSIRGAGAALGALALLLGAPLAPVAPGQARAASFDCAKAASKTEIALCADPRLSQLDGELGVAYQARLARDPDLRQIQRGWLQARNVGCVADRGCLMQMMTAELSWLNSGLVRPPADMPHSVGACSLTQVSTLESRLEGAPDSGSMVELANGIVGVSYEMVPAVQRARVGDPVIACLVQLPSDCPPGDDRGKDYAAADLRTLGAWSLPDAEHMCGGA
jgi:uncharacterized protein